MANFFDNFNNDPVSTEVQTTSYTIPSGQYAKVRVTGFNEDFKIDGNIALHCALNGVNIIADASTSGTALTNTTNYTLHGVVSKDNSTGGPTGLSTGENIYTGNPYSIAPSTSAASFRITLPPNGVVSYTRDGPLNDGLTVTYNLKPLISSTECSFWVPEDTLLEGDSFVVELYNKQGA